MTDNEYATDYDNEDIVIHKTGDGVAVILPRSASRLEEEQRLLLRELFDRGQALRSLEESIDSMADQARAEGISWSLIGFAIGITGETARQRYGQP